MRQGTGVHEAELPDGSPVWVVTGYDAVIRLLADPVMSASKADSTTGFRGQNLPTGLNENLLNLHGDQHRRVRQLAAAAFAPRHHPAHEKVVAEAVGELVEDLPTLGVVDLMGGLCEPLPPRVIGPLLGLPREQMPAFRAAISPLLRLDGSHVSAAVRESMATVVGLVAGAIADKRADPREDLLSQWIAARDGEDRLSENELMSLAFLTITGGLENVTSMTALVLDELVRHHQSEGRESLDRPADFAALIGRLIDITRPTNFALRRFPLTDIDVNGVRIPRGHTVFLSLRSANLDPARRGRPHVVFGYGRHYCIGAALAEMEAVHLARAVLQRYPRLEVLGPREGYRLRSSWLTYALAELRVSAL
ncbi:cytochrome P450 [Nocardia sp. NPDC059091]|uniref:cytochrome P450 n=1 Tax=unclassified Nocardia TaxID=2637762 RepID=UPI00367CA37E